MNQFTEQQAEKLVELARAAIEADLETEILYSTSAHRVDVRLRNPYGPAHRVMREALDSLAGVWPELRKAYFPRQTQAWRSMAP